jgi:hypothetical protein
MVNKVNMKNIQSREEFIGESINQQVRAKIVVQLKSEGIIYGEDYDYSGGQFLANDMETAEAIADAVAGKFRCTIYDDRIGADGKVPMMIIQ